MRNLPSCKEKEEEKRLVERKIQKKTKKTNEKTNLKLTDHAHSCKPVKKRRRGTVNDVPEKNYKEMTKETKRDLPKSSVCL